MASNSNSNSTQDIGFFYKLHDFISPHFGLSGDNLYRSFYLSGIFVTSIMQFVINVQFAKYSSLITDEKLAKDFKYNLKLANFLAIPKFLMFPISEKLSGALTKMMEDSTNKHLIELSLQDNNLKFLKNQVQDISNPSKIMSTDIINFNLQFPFIVSNVLRAVCEFASGIYTVSTMKSSNKYAIPFVLGFLGIYVAGFYELSKSIFSAFKDNKDLDSRLGGEIQEAERNAIQIIQERTQEYKKEKLFNTIDELYIVNSRIENLKFLTALFTSIHDLLKDEGMAGRIIEMAGNNLEYLSAKNIGIYTQMYKSIGYAITWNNSQFYKVADFINLLNRAYDLKHNIMKLEKTKIKYEFSQEPVIKIENFELKEALTNKTLISISSLVLSHKFIKISSSSEEINTKFFDSVFNKLDIQSKGKITLPNFQNGQKPIIHYSNNCNFYSDSSYAEIITQKINYKSEISTLAIEFLEAMGVDKEILINLNNLVAKGISEHDKVALQLSSLFNNPPPRILILDNIFYQLDRNKTKILKESLEYYFQKHESETITIFSDNNLEDNIVITGNSFDEAWIYKL